MKEHKEGPMINFPIKNESFQRTYTRIARGCGLTPEEAEDCLQDLAVRIIEVGEKFYRGEAPMKTYLYKIYRNLCINIRRKKGRYTRHSLIEMSEVPSEPNPIQSLIFEAQVSNKPNPLEILTQKEDKITITRALSKLPPHYRKALRLHTEGLTYKEIAAETRTTVSIIKNTLPAAKIKLRQILSGYYIQ